MFLLLNTLALSCQILKTNTNKQNLKLNYVLLCVFSWQQIRRGKLPRISYRSKCRASGSTTSWIRRAARFRTQSCLTTLLAWRGHSKNDVSFVHKRSVALIFFFCSNLNYLYWHLHNTGCRNDNIDKVALRRLSGYENRSHGVGNLPEK